MPKVTIIIPILNVFPYLRECLDSVVNQTLADIEIFCIDAGSTDGSLELEQEYAQKDPRIRILEDTARSTGYAKNLGIKQAAGKYVAIVESDDYIALDMMDRLYDTAEKYDLEVVKGNFRTFLGERGSRLFVDKAVSLNPDDYEKVINPQTDNRYFSWDMHTWTGLYRKSFLEEYNILHNESKGAAYQDVGFWFQTFCHASRVYLTRDYFYHYRKDNPNASIKNPGRTFVMCEELKFVRDVISGDEQTWERVRPAYYYAMFSSYFATYKRLDEHLRAEFLERFYAEMREGYDSGKLRRDLFDAYELGYLDALLLTGGDAAEKGGPYQAFEDKFHLQQEGTDRKQRELFDVICRYPYCIIFSAGSHGCNLQVMLKQRFQKDITAFCDNDAAKQGKTVNGVKVMLPGQAEQSFPGAVYLIANKIHGRQIQQQLEEMAVEKNRIIHCRVEELIDGFL